MSAILLYNDAQRVKAESVVHRMVKRAVEMEGTVTVSAWHDDTI
jgi:D-lactate dehydrogenase (cytochrome)